MKVVLWLFSLVVFHTLVVAKPHKEYPLLDGGAKRYFNGLYYPRVDKIEACDNPTRFPRTCVEFHVYSKKAPVPIDLAISVNFDHEAKKTFIKYNFKNRGEILCRHMSDVPHFDNDKYKVFVDRTETELDKYIFTMDPELLIKDYKRKNKPLEMVPVVPFSECKQTDDVEKNEQGNTGSNFNSSSKNPQGTTINKFNNPNDVLV